MARVRKAIIAGAGAGLAAVFGSLSKVLEDGAVSSAEVGTLIGVFAAAAVAVGWTTYRVPNKQ